jgi:hypothetical protein
MTRATDENRDITAFSQKHQNQHDTILSSFQAIEGSVQATGETFIAPLTFAVLNVFADATFAIPKDCV